MHAATHLARARPISSLDALIFAHLVEPWAREQSRLMSEPGTSPMRVVRDTGCMGSRNSAPAYVVSFHVSDAAERIQSSTPAMRSVVSELSGGPGGAATTSNNTDGKRLAQPGVWDSLPPPHGSQAPNAQPVKH